MFLDLRCRVNDFNLSVFHLQTDIFLVQSLKEGYFWNQQIALLIKCSTM